ncbi:formylglycine-generating enzyme family protein [Luteolibacter arcticus]|uniref:Formylglycine-generating enzyme family protein n=1 Tax=Luteolibacter arcticus TaxID=1581411 RepID=A0ABT3GFW5_9BACT|nr:formylglycine-generating enzyme family protein [Luteolibacter arcticus]MCW1922318.1 formylglycine-generating enzyme family protein [Luteolibacter arcticus]
MRTVRLLLLFSYFATLAGAAEMGRGENDHRLVRVAAGEYALGAADHRFNKAHRFKTDGFLISDTETTNGQFAAFVKATGYQTRAERTGWSLSGGEGSAEWEWKRVDGANWRLPFGPDGPAAEKLPDHPVTQISGEDARAYCRWIGGRLPTIDEWETAARAGATTPYPWDAEFSVKACNIWNGASHLKNTREDGHVLTAPVRSFPPNAWGLHDVIGNVFEYCEGHAPWMESSIVETRICGRGGSWWCSANSCHFYNLLDIGSMAKGASLPNQGFRVVFDLPAKDASTGK